MKLSQLHESFLRDAERPLFNVNNMPVKPRPDGRVIIPTGRWESVDGRLEKTFRFSSSHIRSEFVRELLDYETSVGHHAVMMLDEKSVMLKLFTRDQNKISELDKEYAKHADLVYRDVTYTNGG